PPSLHDALPILKHKHFLACQDRALFEFKLTWYFTHYTLLLLLVKLKPGKVKECMLKYRYSLAQSLAEDFFFFGENVDDFLFFGGDFGEVVFVQSGHDRHNLLQEVLLDAKVKGKAD